MSDYCVYILANEENSVLYIGVTGELSRRMAEHKNGEKEGFTKRYRVTKLVHVEHYSDVKQAILREKVLKKWARVKKEKLIEINNPQWLDLWREG